jgi:hypothetical protein
VPDAVKRTFLPQGMAQQWREELTALRDKFNQLGREIKHVEMKIELAERIEDDYSDLLKALQAKPEEAEYLPRDYGL